MLGATLWSVDIDALGECWQGAYKNDATTPPNTDDCTLKHITTFYLSRTQATATPDGALMLCLTNVQIYPMRGERTDIDVIQRGEIHILGEKVVSVLDLNDAGTESCATDPAVNVRVYDLDG